ncbi:MAG: diacylglycerol kinase family protein [bacterium]
MANFNTRIFFRSFRYAAKGLRYALRHEQSFRVQLFCALVTIFLMIVLRVTRTEALILTVVISSVLVLEIVNTVFEQLIDVLKPRVHYFVEVMKDLMAAAVFLAALAALVVGMTIFLPHFSQLL